MCRSTVSSCQHGELGAHDSSVLKCVIDSQRSIIETMKVEAQVSSDASFALAMRLEIITQEIQRNIQQELLYGFIMSGQTFDDSDSEGH